MLGRRRVHPMATIATTIATPDPMPSTSFWRVDLGEPSEDMNAAFQGKDNQRINILRLVHPELELLRLCPEQVHLLVAAVADVAGVMGFHVAIVIGHVD